MARTFKTSEWILIALANACGQDKKTWDERLQYAKEHMVTGFNLTDDIHPEELETAVACWNAFQNGEPTGYGIALDATSSGSQILAMLTTDFSAAKVCNLDSPDVRFDMYTHVFNKMKDSMPELNNLGITRDEVKEAIMTALYGSVDNPLKLFNNNLTVGNLFFDAIEESMPNVLKWMEVIKYKSQPSTYTSWLMPDGFKVHFRNWSQIRSEFVAPDSLRNQLNNLGVDGGALDGISYTYRVNFNPALETGSKRYDKQYYELRHGHNARDFEYENTTVNRSMMPNMCHAFDSYIAREIMRAAKLPQEVRDGGFIAATKQEEKTFAKYVDYLLNYWKVISNSKTIPERFMLSFAVFSYLTENIYNSLSQEDKDRIDALRKILPKKSFNVKPIHDSFAVLPCYANDLRRVALHVYMDIARNAYLFRPYLAEAVGIDLNRHFGNMWGDEQQQKEACFKLADIMQTNAEYFIC